MLEAQKLSIQFATLPRLLSMFHFYYRSIAIAALISRLIDSSMYCYSLRRKGLKGCEPVYFSATFPLAWPSDRKVPSFLLKSFSNDGGEGSKTLQSLLKGLRVMSNFVARIPTRLTCHIYLQLNVPGNEIVKTKRKVESRKGIRSCVSTSSTERHIREFHAVVKK